MQNNITTEKPSVEKKDKNFISVLMNVVTTVVIIITLFVMLLRMSVFGISFYGVLTSSMDGNYDGSFKKGDLVISKTLSATEKKQLVSGDVITFYTEIEGVKVINTHRIMGIDYNYSRLTYKDAAKTEIDYVNSTVYYITAGDNNLNMTFNNGEKMDDITIFYFSNLEEFNEKKRLYEIGYDESRVPSADILGLKTSKISGLGTFVNFTQSNTGFLVFVVIPCFIILGVCIYYFVISLNSYKKEKMEVEFAEREAIKNAELQTMLETEKERIMQEERERIRRELLAEMSNNTKDNDKKDD